MNRILIGAAGLALIAGTANAALIGIDIREDKNLTDPGFGPPTFPGADNIRVFNMYAMFDAAGTPIQQDPNAVLNVGHMTPGAPPLDEGFGINIGANPNATFYRSPPAAGGSTTGAFDGANPGDGRRDWNTFVSIGIKQFNSYDDPSTPDVDNTSGDPDFGFHTQRAMPLEDRPLLQRSDWISGGWFNSNAPSFQGSAQDLGDGTFGTFLGQFSVMFPDPDAELGSLVGQNEDGAYIWDGDIFIGGLLIFTQDPAGGAIQHEVIFIPTPGALAVFGLAGLAGLRRRR
ncbi:MAG: hypothetical protein EA376_10485 [Phycisphaeraceae bacterium]|nr:MAG: hypothetical protein EA376_10485 [Phycisphaeraceae bacterium]